MHHCAERLRRCSELFCSYQRCVSALFCPWHSIRQSGLAACKTLASKQNILEGYGAKLHQARAFPKSLLFIEELDSFGQQLCLSSFIEVVFCGSGRRQTARSARVDLRPSSKDARAATLSPRTDRRRPQKQEVCVFGQPEPGLRGRRLRRDQFGCAAEG